MNMNKEQKEFLEILDKHCIDNECNFTSNEFHTIWGAVEEYRKLKQPQFSGSFCSYYKSICMNTFCSVTPQPKKCSYLKKYER